MATSEPLIPNDRPYGERQALVAQRQLAGVPSAPSGPHARSAGPGPAQSSDPSRIPQGYDVLAGRAPQTASQIASRPPVDSLSMLRDRMMNSPSPLWRELAGRVFGGGV